MSYLSELRSRIRRGLLKVEQLHALARDVYYGRGERRLSPRKANATLLQHVSPIEWDNVILYGQYVLDHARVR